MTIDINEMFDKESEDTLPMNKPTALDTTLKIIPYSMLIDHELNRDLSMTAVMDLVDSILLSGLNQLPLVTPIEGGQYKIVAGHHRMAAIKYIVEELGKDEFTDVRCLVREMDAIDAEIAMYDTNLKIEMLSSYDRMIAIGRKAELIRLKKKRKDPLPGLVRDIIASETSSLEATQVQTYMTVYSKATDETKERLKRNEITLTQALATLTPAKKKKNDIAKDKQWLDGFLKFLNKGVDFLSEVEVQKLQPIVDEIKERMESR